MRVVTFLMCLCFLLLRGEAYAFAGSGHRYCYSLARNGEMPQWVGFVNSNRDRRVMRQAHPYAEQQFMISETVEEEDTDRLLAGKYRVLAYWALAALFCAAYIRKSAKAPPSREDRPIHRYITQRVLRI